ncbi:hypothetical protein [Tabrizicola oligotrophica]|uniref:DUF3298 domain-containing protein n=1 Tax=Tabrizicola oligotrophica TaxID=2710650 RepID=A0A6M0QSM6_9RHOB|nr:hypothetical protein [Tabrizicola oligotrophica]NEY90426.1 hypothetical protein [Tabrizicola oligotrophica]
MTMAKNLVAVALLLVGAPGAAEEVSFTLKTRPDLAEGIAALPRLVGEGQAIRQINALLSAKDAEVLALAKDCNSDPPNSFYERSLAVTFDGPLLLSILVETAFYCPGAAHGLSWVEPLNFDVSLGTATDMHGVFPAAFIAKPTTDPKGYLPPRFTPEVAELYISSDPEIDPDCANLIRDNEGLFDVWPNAAQHGLTLMPFGLAYFFTFCQNPVTIPTATLRQLGFDKALLEALEASE